MHRLCDKDKGCVMVTPSRMILSILATLLTIPGLVYALMTYNNNYDSNESHHTYLHYHIN